MFIWLRFTLPQFASYLSSFQTDPNSIYAETQEKDGTKIANFPIESVSTNGSEITIVLKNVTHHLSVYYSTTTQATQMGNVSSGVFSNYAEMTSTSGSSGSTGSGSGSGNVPDGSLQGHDNKDVRWGGHGDADGVYIGDVTLTKTAAGTADKLSGAVFDLEKMNLATGKYETYQKDITTNDAGQIWF
ncbi:hypothetical protein [Levilactobacillus zymae]|uniref:hypothetical protein n=1 Tax=Levilactobacillus zymae TaxID=267363 RepID=UPI0028B5329B|nr:hypothetical protein [Levilactobacillus zymae]MDT6980807.1 hypothetical protein [Levilactobacillus zymae]